MKKTKIAVIGGGLGSMSAVYHIMQLPNAKELYDITVYQTGWRLGGKGGSGVNQKKGHRVEEHGIHFWFGFYENGFRMMRDVYGSLDRPIGAPLETFEDAFKGQATMDFTQFINSNWTDWQITFPQLPGKVGDGHFLKPEQLFEVAFNWLADEFHKHVLSRPENYLHKFLHLFDRNLTRPRHDGLLERSLQSIEQRLENTTMHVVERHLRAIGSLLSIKDNHALAGADQLIGVLQSLHQWIWNLIGELVETNPDLLRIWCAIDFGIAVARGMIEDEVIYFDDEQMQIDVSRINQYNFIEWLVLNGANRELIFNFPAVKSMYDGPFAFFRGAISSPDVEAGTALNIFLRLVFTCKENVMWRMQAGMGDTIFAPIYQLCRKEFPDNVHFEFFSRVKNLKLGATPDPIGEQPVIAIEIEKQVNITKGPAYYDPLIDVHGLACWPSEPLYDQLDLTDGQKKCLQKLHEEKIGLESDWTPWKGEIETKTYGEDFDQVLIGGSLASLPFFCPELIMANPKWAMMLDQVGTVQTQAFQLWLNKTPAELDIDNDQKVVSCYVEPLDTFAVMNQVLKREDWSNVRDKPKCLVYVCGAMPDSENIPPTNLSYFPAFEYVKAFESAKEYVLQNLQVLMPGAFDGNNKFDWNLLTAPDDCEGEERLDYQYFRANIDTSERYVFALKGSTQYRLRADESGFKNVCLTGDWIKNGINIGSVEGAVISGIQAAEAITGTPIPVYVPW
jgi:uncharacterized protein with NAD-binding domain and iron-sulfur cluster